ncbi:GNAT family N-acetyltransferase [Pontibacter fetidus]|uniref:GNAT family N-acetyltransferase n=1 Tax=Pontibacter fetidus TaxID=2700082 RepID=A0A6B2H8V2_9BACT|nr:GNAT family N-acetyltransferase [Pontibacter fetidus]NDK57077.1 GNAT family N-acetyltransferase [Pontibacter fetidus]
MNYILETERLRLREFTLADADFIVALLNSPGWLQYIGDRNVRTIEQATAYLQNNILKSYEVNGYGSWLVERKDDGQAIGSCGIINREALDTPDIGFAFLPEYNGFGYAYECAAATMAYAKEQLNIPKMGAIVLPSNDRSVKLLKKIGLQYVKPFYLPNSEEELHLYSS